MFKLRKFLKVNERTGRTNEFVSDSFQRTFLTFALEESTSEKGSMGESRAQNLGKVGDPGTSRQRDKN